MSAARKAINCFVFLVKTLALERKSDLVARGEMTVSLYSIRGFIFR